MALIAISILTISLPKWNKKRVEHAARYAGPGYFFWDFGKAFVFFTLSIGRGNKRARAVETMKEYLINAGYDVDMYYQILKYHAITKYNHKKRTSLRKNTKLSPVKISSLKGVYALFLCTMTFLFLNPLEDPIK
ncbi:hypothetical protein ALO_20057 [Acetonema longum DSM 6540]|uniref:Uncharacterized protein n=1 Tax=Acetonema longum DSM 6540 TaxID=1009370 RepID=F7NPG6_9FIRM|nr:hypothetical protein ALO_20057 [Acetonema longum DSM 6540]